MQSSSSTVSLRSAVFNCNFTASRLLSLLQFIYRVLLSTLYNYLLYIFPSVPHMKAWVQPIPRVLHFLLRTAAPDKPQHRETVKIQTGDIIVYTQYCPKRLNRMFIQKTGIFMWILSVFILKRYSILTDCYWQNISQKVCMSSGSIGINDSNWVAANEQRVVNLLWFIEKHR